MSVNLDPRPGDPFRVTTHLLQKINELESDNAVLRDELDLWRDGNIIREEDRNELIELRADKERLKAKVKELRASNKYYRAAIDAARKENG